MKPDVGKLGSHLRCGAVGGMVVWLWYAVFESVVADLMSAFTAPDDSYTFWYWFLTASLMVTYLAVGVASGVLVAAVLHVAVRILIEPGEDLSGDIHRIVSLLVVPVFAASLMVTFGFIATAITLLSALAINGAALAAAGADRRQAALHGATLAWSVPLVLAGTAWVGLDLLIDAETFATPCVLAIGAVAAAAVARWAPQPRPAGRAARVLALRSPDAVLLAAAMVLAIAYTRVEPPPRLPADRDAAPAPRNRPNVVLIVLDTVRAASLSLYGYARDTTPFLRDLARQATVYTRAIAPAT